jgi:serine/threonine-protein kinase
VKKGDVITTTPLPGSTAASDTSITLDVSSGPQLVSLVNLVNDQYSVADPILASNGFVVKEVFVPTLAYAAGTVLGEIPTSKKAPYGSTVTLDVAAPPKVVVVPPLIGDTQQQADTSLTALGLLMGTTTVAVTDPTQQGLVQSQLPLANHKVKPGTTVTVAIGSYTSTTSPTGPSGPSGPSGAS